MIKRSHWLLLRNPTKLAEHKQVRLSEASQSLMTVYVMKEPLKALWNAPTAWTWRAAWKQ